MYVVVFVAVVLYIQYICLSPDGGDVLGNDLLILPERAVEALHPSLG
jgi:hypothetical protein